MADTYHELVSRLQNAGVINNSGDEKELFTAADAIFETYEADIKAATIDGNGQNLF
ncbi:MAG: hypothetical protein IPI23_22090 [Bacteroidetes bacterium]|nr:hypothetical protein [Bacteroidota bacterium]